MPSNLRRPLHVLLVEQDHAIRDLIATLLRNEGYAVSAVGGALPALQRARVAAPDAVISSLVFGDLDGLELCRRLRAMPHMAHALIVALTGYATAGIREMAREAGFDSYLLKPVSVHTLLDLLASYKTGRVIAAVGGAPGAARGTLSLSD